jgi:hypothetical protein
VVELSQHSSITARLRSASEWWRGLPFGKGAGLVLIAVPNGVIRTLDASTVSHVEVCHMLGRNSATKIAVRDVIALTVKYSGLILSNGGVRCPGSLR